MSLVDIKEKILAAEKKHHRATGSTTLIAVSKVQPIERVKLTLNDGHRVFGENRVQELIIKNNDLKRTSVHTMPSASPCTATLEAVEYRGGVEPLPSCEYVHGKHGG